MERICYDDRVVDFTCPVTLARFLAQLTREGVGFAVRSKSSSYWSVLIERRS